MSAVVIDGGIVHYEAFGRGRPLLFLHGWLGSWRYWMPTMEALSDKNRTYALDLWGFGDSDKSNPRYAVSDYVALLNNFMDNMPVVPDAIGRSLVDFANNSMMSKMMWWRQITYKEVQKEAEKTGEKAISLSLQSVAQIDVKSRLEIISQLPDSMLLAVYGEKDDMIDPAPARALDGQWSNIRSIGLTESKHFPMLDETAKFNRLLKDFMEAEGDLSVLELKEEWRRRTR
jgi:hypothetical protein